MEISNDWVNLSLSRGPIRGRDRNRVGLVIRIKARRDVEDFMAGLGDGLRTPVDVVGDTWHNCSPVDNPLEFYNGTFKPEGKQIYTLDGIGQGLFIEHQDQALLRRGIAAVPEEKVNISFLRLAGISDESGVSVGLTGAYSKEYIMRARTSLPAAIEQFLHSYIVPININLHIVSKG